MCTPKTRVAIRKKREDEKKAVEEKKGEKKTSGRRARAVYIRVNFSRGPILLLVRPFSRGERQAEEKKRNERVADCCCCFWL